MNNHQLGKMMEENTPFIIATRNINLRGNVQNLSKNNSETSLENKKKHLNKQKDRMSLERKTQHR